MTTSIPWNFQQMRSVTKVLLIQPQPNERYLGLSTQKKPGDVSCVLLQAMNALLVFSALWNRPKLAKVIIKYSDQPIMQILFAESLFHSMYRDISNVAIRGMLKNTANEFADVAVELFNAGIGPSPVRGHAILTRNFSDFNNKTPLDLAYDTNNKYSKWYLSFLCGFAVDSVCRKFVAHNTVQTWLDQYYHNFIKVKGNFDSMKLFFSGLFIFPMYIWLTFPRLRKPSPIVSEVGPRGDTGRGSWLETLCVKTRLAHQIQWRFA